MQRTVLVKRLQTLTEVLFPAQVRRPKLSWQQICGAGRSVWRRACVAGLLWAAAAISSPAQAPDTLVNFDGTNGGEPATMSMIQGTDGNLWGTTLEGGATFVESPPTKATARSSK